MKSLLRVNGFLPFLFIAFINAFVDSGHKIIIQNTLFKVYDGNTQILLTAVVNALVLLPFILLFSPSGFLSDRYPKHKIMRASAYSAVVITLGITLCYYMGWFVAAFGLTFVLAVQSAIYSPAKYGYIKSLLGTNNLSAGNGWLQAVTMIAILCGILVFSLLFETLLGGWLLQATPERILQIVAPLGWVLVFGSLIEVFLSYRLVDTQDNDALMRFNGSEYAQGKMLLRNLTGIFANRTIWTSIVGIALFWAISQMMLAVFPAFVEAELGETNTFVIQGAMALAGVGIMLGSMIAVVWSRKGINLGLVPLGAFGIAVGLVLLPMAQTILHMALLFLLIGMAGAMLNVPLNAKIQLESHHQALGRVLAGNNFIQNIFMVTFLSCTVAAAVWDINAAWLLWFLGVIAVGSFIVALFALPRQSAKGLMALVFKTRYKVRVEAKTEFPPKGQGVLLLGNHVSWIDWALIQLVSPRHVYFVMERGIYQHKLLRWALDLYGVVPISSGGYKQSLNRVNELLSQGEVVCLFPEGVISYLGIMGEFKSGYTRALKGTGAKVLPFYIHGLWGSRFSRASKSYKQASHCLWRRNVVISIEEPLADNVSPSSLKQAVTLAGYQAWQAYSNNLSPISCAFVRQMKRSRQPWQITNSDEEPLTAKKFLAATMLYSARFKTLEGQNVGVLLPTTVAGSLANMSLLMAGKTVVNLNFTATSDNLLYSIQDAEIKTLVTSRQFITVLRERGIDLELALSRCTVIYMEDGVSGVPKAERLGVMASAVIFPSWLIRALWCQKSSLDDPAAIMFTSGSEDRPKGVVLTHRNLMANIKQLAAVLNVREGDRIMATLPQFHAFGFTVTRLLPLIEGIPVVCHPDPRDGAGIAKGIARHQATLLCATSTFLRLYVKDKSVDPMLLRSLRIVVAGAEKLDQSIRMRFEDRFNKPVVEGFGCTETSPVTSTNLPDRREGKDWELQLGLKNGSVGHPLPGTLYLIVDPETYEVLPVGEAGLLLIAGPQVMQGYLNDKARTDKAVCIKGGIKWYATGDKGALDKDGFLTIVDRYSRFAKLAGETISLGSIEAKVRDALGEDQPNIVAVAIPDDRKGEKIVMLVDEKAGSYLQVAQGAKKRLPPLQQPSEYFLVADFPMMMSGKIDYACAKRIAIDLSLSSKSSYS